MWPYSSRKSCPYYGLHLAQVILLLVPVLVRAQDPDYTCSATKKCALGCCSVEGVCGMGPDYCSAAKCISTCDAKAECDPGGWGSQYASRETCPLNVCCSKFGFCGTSPEFCGSNVIANPSCSGTSASKRTIGYYEGWGVGRACDAMYPEEIPAGPYTHLNFAFASIDPVSFAVAPMSPGDVPLYSRLTGLKTLYPDLEVWISIGGWTMNDPDQSTATTFSDLAASPAAQKLFFASLISFMTSYGFDGVDIDWEYPVAPERSGRPEDFANYPTFLKNMRAAFQAAGHNYGITLTLPSSFWYLQNFDVVELEKATDWLNMMSYDLHGTWDSTSVWTGPKLLAHTNLTEIDQALKLLWRNNINPGNVVLGIGFYGRSFEMKDTSCSTAGCEFSGGGAAGPCTDSIGTLSYSEIKRIIAAGATPRLDRLAAVQTLVYNTNNWVSYDDATTLQIKVDYANSNCLGGTMVWAASLDDENGSAATALSGKANNLPNLHIGIVIQDQLSQCLWASCKVDCDDGNSPNPCPASCPDGYTEAWKVRDGCPQPSGSLGPFNARSFCCPNNDVPSCSWSKIPATSYDPATANNWKCESAPCKSGDFLLTSSQFYYYPMDHCATGELNVCCKSTASTKALSQCMWAGTPPLCALFSDDTALCPSGYSAITDTLRGDGGSQACTRGYRTLCCAEPIPFKKETCAWYQNAFHGICSVGCPEGKLMMAIDSEAAHCTRGQGSYCCDLPVPASQDLTPSTDTGLRIFQETIQAYLDYGQCSPRDSSLGSLRKRASSPAGGIYSQNIASLLVSVIMMRKYQAARAPSYIKVYNDAVNNAPAGSLPPVDFTHLEAIVDANPAVDTVEILNEVFCSATKKCSSCDCIMGNAKHVPADASEDQLTMLPSDWPRNLSPTGQKRSITRELKTALLNNTSEGFMGQAGWSVDTYQVTENPVLSGRIFKRYYICAAPYRLSYENNYYPPAAAPNSVITNSHADSKPAVTKYIDVDIYPSPGLICHWGLSWATPRRVGQRYGTEHVFEKHMIKTFLEWVENGPCQRANCADIDAVFGHYSPDITSGFSLATPLDSMASRLSSSLNLAEFFIVDASVNGAKTLILSTLAGFNGVPTPITTTWQDAVAQIRVYTMAFAYMNRPEVRNVMRDTNRRMRAILNILDIESQNYAPPNTCLIQGGPRQTPGTWMGIWDEWISDFLSYKQSKMQDWILDAVFTLESLIVAQTVPPLTGLLLTEVTSMTATGGLMSQDAVTFDVFYHNLT